MECEEEITNFDDKILLVILKEYKSVTEIADELGVPRNRIQVHIFKLRKWKEVVRVMNDDKNQGVLGYKYKASYQIVTQLKKKLNL